MEEAWSKICMKWVQLLNLSPSSNIISLTDGKFFLSFMKRYLNLDRECYTATETFEAVEATLRNEFCSLYLVNLAEAQQGNEEELVKTITLFMYLAVVKYEHFGPKTHLDDAKFSEEAKFRMKCILKALLEQHGVLTPSLLSEIINNKVITGIGHLSAGVANKLRSVSRVAMGSPVVFTNSPSLESPLKEFLDSPTVRQVTRYQRQVKEKDGLIRELRAQLEAEKMDKQGTVDKLEQLRQDKDAADIEVLALKQEIRKRFAAPDIDDSCDDNNSELSEKFHNLLKEKKDIDRYLASVEKQLEETTAEKVKMQARLDALVAKLNAVQEEKRQAEIISVKVEANLASLNIENDRLQEIIQKLGQELNDLTQQQQLNKSFPRKATATVASFHLETMDMGDVSVDADESCYVASIDVGSVAGENMMDVVERRLEEKIERLVIELGTEVDARIRDRDAAKLRIEVLEAEAKEKQKQVEVYKQRSEQLEARLDLEVRENNMLNEKMELVNRDKEVINVMLEDTKADLIKHVEDNIRMTVELDNSHLVKSKLEEKIYVMENNALVLNDQLVKEVKIKEDLKENINVQKQNVDQKEKEIDSLIRDLSSATNKLREAEEKGSNLIASLEAKSSSDKKLIIENKRMSEEKHNMEEMITNLTGEISELKLKLDRLNKELCSKSQDNHGNLQYLQSELENKKRDLYWEQMKTANLEKSMTNQDIKTALKDQKERYQKKHKEIITELMEKNAQKMEELKSMCIEKNEGLEHEIKKLKMENKIVLAKYEDSKQKLTSMMENFTQIKASSRQEMDMIHQKLNYAKDKISKFKKENDLIIVQLKVAKETNKDLLHIIEASKIKNVCDPEKQSAKKTRVSSNLTSRKSSLPDFKVEDDVFEIISVSAGRTTSDGQVAPALKSRPPSGSGSLFHCDEEQGEVFSTSNLMAISSSRNAGMKVDCCEGDAEGRISEMARRNSMYLPHLKSSYPVESQFLQEKFSTEDEIRHSNIKLQQPANPLAIKEFPHHDNSKANVGGQSTSKHPGRAKRQFSEEGFEKEDVPRMGMVRFKGQSGKGETTINSEPHLQSKPKMPELVSPRPAKRKHIEKDLKESSQASNWSKRRKGFWSKTKEREGEPLLP